MQKVLDVWAKCKHPNLLQLIRQETFQGRPVAVYGRLEYGGIQPYLKHHPEADPYQLSAQICEGVVYLHNNGIIHGNLKGRQILVSVDGVPRIQLSIETSTTIVDAGRGLGNIRWTAPKLFMLGFKRTLASDVFALGMTILESIIRDIPYATMPPDCSLSQIITAGVLPSRPIEIIPDNHAGNSVWGILCECWSHRPDDRPAAAHVRDFLLTVSQASGGPVLKLVVSEGTTMQDLVSHFEGRGLMNYTNLLQETDITAAAPYSDTKLANVYKVQLSNQQWVAIKCVKHVTPYKNIKV
ncbi:unnamed protein product [Rhizoctonia solani]|uniref:Protein kinase domain-containing protein n=1 Tax=Rhizoctonia solani TaxID=456999 RepID=A0A8H3D091_9AGAM|nr:unnamed protein product [Rhizoctonia solani]